MRNWKLTLKLIGILLFIEAALLFACMCVSWFYREDVMPFVWSILVAVGIGSIFTLLGVNSAKSIGRRDGYFVVSVTWIVFSFIGMLPFLFEGCIKDVASAFLETMSGFTSTGATVIDDLSKVPNGIIFWRSMTQWIGGLGIIFFTIAVLPAFGVGEVKLFAAESVGPISQKVHPRISIAAKWIWSVNMLLTLGSFISLLLCGMGVFDAVNISMATVSTGGFAPTSILLHDAYNSRAVEYVITFFMFASGINFTLLYYTILRGQVKSFFRDAELRCYMIIVSATVAVCTIVLHFISGRGLEEAFRASAFTVVSLQTTTGFATYDYTLWPEMLVPVLLIVMVCGGCSGSTSGAFKCIRLSMIARILKNEFTRILHPQAVLPVKINNSVVSSSVRQTLLAFTSIYAISIVAGILVLCFCGVQFYESVGLSITSLGNVGPGIGYFGPSHTFSVLPPVAKWTCSFLMLIGRLEIFPIILIFTRSYWKKS